MAISPQQLTIYLYSAHRAVIFATAQLSCLGSHCSYVKLWWYFKIFFLLRWIITSCQITQMCITLHCLDWVSAATFPTTLIYILTYTYWHCTCLLGFFWSKPANIMLLLFFIIYQLGYLYKYEEQNWPKNLISIDWSVHVPPNSKGSRWQVAGKSHAKILNSHVQLTSAQLTPQSS